jgi:peroxiredoxin
MDGTLGQKLAAYARRLEELNFPFADAYNTLVARLIDGGIGAHAPGVGEAMPPFMLPSHGGNLVHLSDLLDRGAVVISFNRGHWCPFCKIELRTIASYHSQIADCGATVVSILPERQQFLGALDADTQGRLLILTDVDNGYALSLGLVMWLGDRLKEMMKGRGLHINEFQGNDGWFLPVPATFVVAPSGIVVARKVDPDFRLRMEVDEILQALRGIGHHSTQG